MILVRSGVVSGIEGFLIDVEVDVRPGLPGFEIVGLPSKTVRESRERVRSALRNTGFRFPAQKVIVNLAPAHIPKDGALFDLPIALGVLAHQGMVPECVFQDVIFAGELSLSGKIKRISGVLSLAKLAAQCGCQLVLPLENRSEAALIGGDHLLLSDSLGHLIRHLTGQAQAPPLPAHRLEVHSSQARVTIKGQAQAKRALEIAALGRHHIMLLGPPGVGKTLLATHAHGLLPPLSFEDILTINKIHEAAGLLHPHSAPLTERPLRAPHHSISQAGLIGSKTGRPGEITLAHLGVLLLDEFPEFNQGALQGLREPLDHKQVQISRAGHSLVYPSDFWLIATANPCPCGYLGSSVRLCTCTGRDINRYRRKLRGPLLDRFEMFVYLRSLSEQELREKPSPWPPLRSATKKDGPHSPALSAEADRLLHQAQERLALSVRGFASTRQIARTIARCAGASHITQAHMAEALQYRFQSQPNLLF
ncbi:MAG: YifB family Mg chelatase-like AAA ATPase [Bacillota bacterium]|nr:YifB family Mg chelatase-like AAA ATPase [Bacillota bacterium]HHT91128.1 YifB family Mg chelatase-like AAA ATPase [Bacillota bacterium]